MIKNQKPIDLEANIKYLCPNKKCRYEHWISLNEARTLGFKIVCDCSTVFCPKRIKRISIIYKKQKQKQIKEQIKEQVINTEYIIPGQLLQKSIQVMQNFGFKKTEAETLLCDFYKKNPIDDYKQLVKKILANKE